MARRGKPLGNKRQHEQAKARKKRDKEARREARKAGTPEAEEGEPPEEGGSTEAPADDPDREAAPGADTPGGTEPESGERLDHEGRS